MIYLMVVGIGSHRISAKKFAIESAFGQHLKMLKNSFGEKIDQLWVATPSMSENEYQEFGSSLMEIDETIDGIFHVRLHHEPCGRIKYLMLSLVPNIIRIFRTVRHAQIVHAGGSYNIFKPLEIISILWGIILQKETIYVQDGDRRRTPEMNMYLNRWSKRTFLKDRYIEEPIRNLQLKIGVRYCSLIMLKGNKLVDDFGHNQNNVKNIIDTVHDETHIASEDELIQRKVRFLDPDMPLSIVYFGRLIEIKGIDRAINAIGTAIDRGFNVTLDVIGSGPDRERLEILTKKCGIVEYVNFFDAVQYGSPLFGKLKNSDILISTPIIEDTPRSAIDALARGIPILAFDTYYYRDLQAESNAVITVEWPSNEQLADKIGEICNNKKLYIPMVDNAIDFARKNTQKIWLDRRAEWTLKFCKSAF